MKTSVTKNLRIIKNASFLYTGGAIRKKDGRNLKPQDIGAVASGALVYTVKIIGKKEIPQKIIWSGETGDIPKEFRKLRSIDLKLRNCITAGLIDSHTHLVFAGDRSDEFSQRCSGVSYETIANEGGGIAKTVQATRKAAKRELFTLACQRVEQARSLGVRTLEIKSGYGLNEETELKQLEVIQSLQNHFQDMTFVSTFLGAHDYPVEISRESYLKMLCEKLIPEVAKRKLAAFCDVFVDRGYYTWEDAKQVLSTAREYGLGIKVHGDELADTNSARQAVEWGATSVDHLLKTNVSGISTLAKSNTVAVSLPVTALYLKTAYAPMRQILDEGGVVAVATDFNPGSAMGNHLPFALSLAALYHGMNVAELLSAVTYSAAKALKLENRKGSLEEGQDADFTVHPFIHFEEIYYRLAWVPEVISR